MTTEADFVDHVNQVFDAYEHLYDLIHLRTSPLVESLVPDPSLSRKQKAWQLHQTLLDVIEELDPGPNAPTFSREWRRHRLMVLHYQQGLDPPSVADQLAISRRHYYRFHKTAIEAAAKVLWDRFNHRLKEVSADSSPAAEGRDSRLMRLEATRAAHNDRYTDLVEVIEGARSLLQEKLDQRRLDIQIALPDSLPSVSAGRSPLRQVILGMVGYLIECAEQATIRLTAQSIDEGTAVCLSVRVEPSTAVRVTSQNETQEKLQMFEEIAMLSGGRVFSIHSGQSVVGFDLQLPAAERTLLVVDDNEDVLRLFQGYLRPHGHRVITAQSVQEALQKIHRLRPQVVILDLMMPERDGWDLLQVLRHQPDTQHIPVVVCSVLKQQRDLALSLGAATFLAKPITEQALVSAIEALDDDKDGR